MKKLFVAAFACAMACGVVAKTVTVSELPTTVTATDAIVVDVGDTVELPALAGSNTYKNIGTMEMGLT